MAQDLSGKSPEAQRLVRAAIATALLLTTGVLLLATSKRPWERLPVNPPLARRLKSRHVNLEVPGAQGAADKSACNSLAGSYIDLQCLGFRQPVEYRPVLPLEALYRGQDLNGPARRHQNFVGKLLRGQSVSVAMVGGSVTAGSGSLGLPYPERFFAWLNATFPHPGSRLKNSGVGGSSAHSFAVCPSGYVPEDVDLVVVELAVNQGRMNDIKSDAGLQFEWLIRLLLAYPSRPAVVLLYHYAYNCCNSLITPLKPGTYDNSAEQALSVFAQYYELPELSLRQAAYHLMRSGTLLINGTVSDGAQYFYSDRTHPGPIGHQALADLLTSMVWRVATSLPAAAPGSLFTTSGPREPCLTHADAAGSVLLGPVGSPPGAAEWVDARGAPALPPPLVPGLEGQERFRCLMGGEFEAAGYSPRQGFEYKHFASGAATVAQQKWSWTGTQLGDVLELLVDASGEDPGRGTAGGLLVGALAGRQEHEAGQEGEGARRGGLEEEGSEGEGGSLESPRTSGEEGLGGVAALLPSAPAGQEQQGAGGALIKIMLWYLRSYESMGIASVECVAGCACKRTTINATRGEHATLNTPHIFQVLVFSDEFNKNGREFGANSKDPRWTAVDLCYKPTNDLEVYKKVTTNGGAANITIDGRKATAISPQPNGNKWSVDSDFVSGMLQGWNKFCYTGGYLEARVLLPGNQDDGQPGAGYMQSTTGQSVGPRLIPLEPAYVLLNLALSNDFSKVTDEELRNMAFPLHMLIDYVRIYQSKGSINTGCSPPEFPTAQFIACNRFWYTGATEHDGVMIRDRCLNPEGSEKRGGALALALFTLSLAYIAGVLLG